MKRFFLTLGLCSVLTSVGTAQANGRFPSAGHIEVDPQDPLHIVVRATYGLVVTRDGGDSWNWVCEKAMSFEGIWDPPIGILANGVIMVGLVDGLTVSTPDACAFVRIPELEGQLVTDVAVDKKNPLRAVVLTSLPLGGIFDTRLFVTNDGGKSFAQVGNVFPDNLRGLTVDLAPSDPNMIYVSGVLDGPLPQGVVLQSKNMGLSYNTFVLPGSDDIHAPFIGAVDLDSADRLYVRLDGTPGRLLTSDNGGQSWVEIFLGEGTLLGFSLSPDNKTLVIGGEKDGVWRSPVSNWAFERTSLLHTRCLRWVDAGVYACSEQVLDGFSLGFSITEASTFKPLARLSDLCGPVSCAKPICTSDWPLLRDTINATPCAPNSSSSSSSSSSSTSGGQGGAGGMSTEPRVSESGCSCRTSGNGSNGTEYIGILPLIALARRRSRRPEQSLSAHLFRPLKTSW
jgi:MYXO-CTERM domain-containing protein